LAHLSVHFSLHDALPIFPFSTVKAKPPANYVGDFYVDEFSDERLRAKWADCKLEEKCRERVGKQIQARRPPNKEYRNTNPEHIRDRKSTRLNSSHGKNSY